MHEYKKIFKKSPFGITRIQGIYTQKSTFPPEIQPVLLLKKAAFFLKTLNIQDYYTPVYFVIYFTKIDTVFVQQYALFLLDISH